MVSEVVKKHIFKQLYKELSNAEIIPYKDSIWFIDREKEFWYFEFEKNGQLWWRFHFFYNFFKIFSFEREQFEFIISDWVEEVLNCKVSTTRLKGINATPQVEEVLNCKVSTTIGIRNVDTTLVEEVLNCKVSTTQSGVINRSNWIKKVLSKKNIG